MECIELNQLSSLSYTPKGIYTDEEFYYYLISIKLKDNATIYSYRKSYEYLLRHDCKLQIYFTDITLNLSNHKDPNTTFINSMFLQLNPTLIQKKIYFI